MNIAIVGYGKAGTYLSQSFSDSGFGVRIFDRNPQENTFPLAELNSAHTVFDLIVLCVKDSAIAKVSSEIESCEALIVHVSGATPMAALDRKHSRRGVFYPVMSLSGEVIPPVSEVPLCLEADRTEDLKLLQSLADRLGSKYFTVSSSQRRHLHLAAVLSQNFTNHLYQLSYEILEQSGLSFAILKPLLRQTLDRIDQGPPGRFQTGPAVRNDQETIARHLDMIADEETRAIYTLLTQSIRKTHDKKL